NEQSRAFVHELRGRVDAVIVGIGTVLADDPLLTARPKTGPIPRIARRVVVDPHLKLPMSSRLVRSLPIPLTVAMQPALLRRLTRKVTRLQRKGVEFVALPMLNRTLQLKPLMQHLATQHAATNVLIEGGPALMGAAMSQGLVDEALVVIAPTIAGAGG